MLNVMNAESASEILLKPDTLWEKTLEVTAAAKATGALKSIETEYQFIEQNGIAFLVRSLANVVRKEKARQQQKKQEEAMGKYIDPFLPYEEDLFVGDITPTHLCLLNKFNVADNHLLLVTRDFEEQTNLLNLNDFLALAVCLQEIDGLSFYNGGSEAGASQRHKHLQLVPLPLISEGERLPLDSAIKEINWTDTIATIPAFPFNHAIAKLDPNSFNNPIAAAQTMLNLYYTLLEKVGYAIASNMVQQPGSYNFLATKNWMLIVPRKCESCQTISINSLGFAGSLFVKNPQDLALLKEKTPIGLLSEVVSCASPL